MGGRAFEINGYESLRMTQEEFDTVKKTVTDLLEEIGLTYFVVESVKEKDSHGDIDILYVTNNEAYDQLKNLFDDDRHLIKRLGGGIHVLYDKKYQIDLIPCSEVSFDFSCNYFSNNDLGNILGRMLRPHGLSLHHDGIYHTYREGGPHCKIQTQVSTNWNDALEILELDKAAYSKSFATFLTMFDWVYDSPYWDSARFQYENLNAINRKRDRKRKTYRAWLEYCETRPVKEVRAVPMTPEERFPMLVERLKQLRENTRTQEAVKERFNGNVVSEITGLTGKPLGMFMSQFVRKYPKSEIALMEDERVHFLIQNFKADPNPKKTYTVRHSEDDEGVEIQSLSAEEAAREFITKELNYYGFEIFLGNYAYQGEVRSLDVYVDGEGYFVYRITFKPEFELLSQGSLNSPEKE